MNLDLRVPALTPLTNVKKFLWFNGQTSHSPSIAAGASLAGNGANVVTLTPIIIPVAMVISRATFQVGTAAAATTANVGLYDINGNLIFDSGPLSTATANAIVSGGVAPVTVQPGIYYFALACTSTTPTDANSIAAFGTTINGILNANTQRVVLKATNVLAGGALPATTGALTNALNANIPAGIFE